MEVWSGADIKVIKPAEAEETTKSLRADLRKADAFRQRGDHAGCARAREQAGKKMAAIGKMLEYRLAERAERHFGSHNPHLVREAVEEIYERLYRDWMDLGPKKRFYEENFDARVKWTAIDVIRRIRVRHGMRANVQGSDDEEKRKDMRHQRALLPGSIQHREQRAEEGERVNLPEDDETLAAIEKFAGPSLMQEILANMPDHAHRKVLILHAIKKLTFKKTAEMTGISERTTQRYYKRATEIVVQIVRGRR